MYVFTDSTLRYLLKKIKSKIALKSELDNKVDKVDGKGLSDNDFTDSAKSLLEAKFNSVEASYSTGMTHIVFKNSNKVEKTWTLTNLQTGDNEGLDLGSIENFISYTCSDHNKIITFEDFDIMDGYYRYGDLDCDSAPVIYLRNGKVIIDFLNPTNSECEFTIKYFGYEETVLDLKTGCDMFFYPTVDAELLADLDGNITIPYAFISKSGNDIGKVTVKIENLTNNTSSENVFNVTDYGSELILEGASSGNSNVSFTIEGNTEELKANVLGEYSTVIMSPLTVYRSTDSSLVPSNVSNPKTVVNDFGNGEYEIMLYADIGTNYLSFSNQKTLTNVSYISDSITTMYYTYDNCNRLTGSPICGNNITDMSNTYYNCTGLTGNPVCGDKVTTMINTYHNCNRLTGSPVCGNNVTSMYSTYSNCYNLTGNPVCGDKVTSMVRTYFNCTSLTGSPACRANVINMAGTYQECYNITGSPVCGPNVTNMHCTYQECYSLTGNAACGPNVIDMSKAYFYSYVPGKAACGNNVTNMSQAYAQCIKLEGPAACGPNVNNMYQAYYNCINLKGTPACGDKVFNMYQAYAYCSNLTGRPIVGNTVEIMTQAYYNCFNLTGDPICGKNIVAMDQAFANCYNLQGNMYLFSNFVQQANSVFNGRNTTNRLNIYYNAGANSYHNTTTHHTLRNAPLTGNTISWTDDRSVNGCYYNAKENIYLYPMVNVREIYKENELLIARYKMNSGADVVPEGTIEGIREVKVTSEDNSSDKFMLGTLGVDITSMEEITTSVGDLYLIDDYTEIYGYVQYRYGAPEEDRIHLMVYSDTKQVNIENIFSSDEITLYIPGQVDFAIMTTMEDAIDDNGRTIIRSVYLDESQVGKLPGSISFNGATDLLTVEKLRTENITDGTNMFKGCSNFKGFEVNEETFIPDFSNIENATSMFEGCSNLEYLDTSGFNALRTGIYPTDLTNFVVTEDESKSMGQFNGIENVEIYSAGFQTKYPFIDKTVTEGVNDIYKFESPEGYYINVVVYPDGNIAIRTTASNDSEVLCLRVYSIVTKNICTIEYADYMFAGCSKLTKESFEKTYYDLKYESDTFTINFNEKIKLFDYPSSEFNFITLNYPMREYEEGYANFNPQIVRSDIYECTYYRFGNTEPIVITVYDDGSIYAHTDGPGGDNKLYLYNKHKYTFELPNVESASHIFDGCTNLQ